MSEPLTSMQAQILDKNKAAVKDLLGEPVAKNYWKNAEPPQNADDAALAAFQASMLDEIWIYSNGRVHFTLAGIAKKVDDKVRLDLPPTDNLVA